MRPHPGRPELETPPPRQLQSSWPQAHIAPISFRKETTDGPPQAIHDLPPADRSGVFQFLYVWRLEFICGSEVVGSSKRLVIVRVGAQHVDYQACAPWVPGHLNGNPRAELCMEQAFRHCGTQAAQIQAEPPKAEGRCGSSIPHATRPHAREGLRQRQAPGLRKRWLRVHSLDVEECLQPVR